MRTAKVAEELRQHRFVNDELEDVLQLPLVLWHAWVSLNREFSDIKEMDVKRNKHMGRWGSGYGGKRVKPNNGA